MRTVLILGAGSAMARALARKLAPAGAKLVLADINRETIEKDADDLAIRAGGEKPVTLNFDAADFDSHPKFFEEVVSKVGVPDEVYVFFGLMYEQVDAERDFKLAKRMMDVNYVGAVSILEPVAAAMEKRGSGLIAAVSSPAGDRGRQSNYIYGSAKAGLTNYLSGLRNRAQARGVHVMTIKPGPTHTPMTAGMEGLQFPAEPEDIAAGILKAVQKRRDVVYLPWFWRGIMFVIRHIPEFVFKKLKL